MNGKQTLIFAATVFVLVGFSGCVNPFQVAPAAVTRSAYDACNAGRYAEAEKLFSSSARQAMSGVGVKYICDMATRNGTIQNFKIDRVDMRGQGATVHHTIRYKNGDTKSDSDDLIVENGAWRITR